LGGPIREVDLLAEPYPRQGPQISLGGNAHCTIEQRRLHYTLQAVIFPIDMWNQ
jgi:hypothetical protein